MYVMCKGQYKMKILSNSIVNHQSKTSISTSFKALKVSSKINKEIATSATNVLTIASAVASSAIAGLAMTKKQKEEEEKQLIQQLQNPNGFIIALGDEIGTHKNITKEDVYSLAQHFEYAPGFISDLILLKDDNGNPRSIKKNEITKIMQAYQENPELVEELVSEKNNQVIDEYQRISFHNSGNDNGYAFVRTALIGELASQAGFPDVLHSTKSSKRMVL